MSIASDRVAAWAAADATLSRLGIDDEAPIDIYDAIDDAGLFLSFRPLENLLGFAIPEGRGVVVTTRRPRTIKRFTAAHELGHCVMHKGLVLDGEQEILGSSSVEQERQAQMFAAYFLLPPPLSYRLAEFYGIDEGIASPGQIYQAARDAGVSFEALTRHFTVLDILSPQDLNRLIDRRHTAKSEASFGINPHNGHADVWPIVPSEETESIEVVLGDEIIVSLPENRTTGYMWMSSSDNQRRSQSRPAPAPPVVGGSPSRARQIPSSVEPLPRPTGTPSKRSIQPENYRRSVQSFGNSENELRVLSETYRSGPLQRPHQIEATRRARSQGNEEFGRAAGGGGEHLT